MSPLLTGFPFTAGSAGTPKATVTSTTGSPTVDTTSRSPKTIYKFTGSGTITVGVGGTCEYLVIGGGNCNGAGGYIYNTSAIIPAGTLTVTVGAGTTSAATGNASRLGDVTALPGGSVALTNMGANISVSGGSSGGSFTTATSPQAAMLGGAQGNTGGQGFTGSMGPSGYGGGGGAGGVGGNAASTASGGNGGAGAANSITGSSVTYCAGGGGFGTITPGSPTAAGGANTGSGGGSGTSGGSGFVVVVIG